MDGQKIFDIPDSAVAVEEVTLSEGSSCTMVSYSLLDELYHVQAPIA